MEPRKNTPRKRTSAANGQEDDLYALDTPRWRKYYQKVRSGIRFPRYYKKAVNW